MCLENTLAIAVHHQERLVDEVPYLRPEYRFPRDQHHEVVVFLVAPSRSVLPGGWSAADCIVSRAVGDRWLDRRHSAILIVPSVVAKYETNVVINPAHPDVKAIVASPPEDVLWDMRLFTK